MNVAKDEPKWVGTLHLTVFDQITGEIKGDYTFKNLIVDTGLAYLAKKTAGLSIATISHIALGSDSTAPAAGNTSLGAELGRATASVSGATTTVLDDTARFSATFGAGTATGNLNEAGLFNAASSGTMVSRVTFPTIPKGANDAVSATWNIQSK